MERANLQKKARRKIAREFRKFRRTTLLYASKQEIWHDASKISFMDAVTNYFEYNDNISEAYLKLAIIEPAILQLMWQVYIKDQRLDCWSWDGINEILEKVLLSWRVKKCA